MKGFYVVKKKKMVLTDEEEAIERSISDGEWSGITQVPKHFYEAAAKNTSANRKKEARVNIRMTAYELSLVKSEAEREGVPYQTLMSSILHKYLTGQFLDRKIVEELKLVFNKLG